MYEYVANAQFVSRIENIILLCRLLYMKFVRAFVSFIRFYSRHDCKLIFRFEGKRAASLLTFSCIE